MQGWSQKDLAAAVPGLDQSAVARIETRQRVVSVDEAQEIAAALGVTILDLLAEVGEGGDRLFYSRVIRPARQLEALLNDSGRLDLELIRGAVVRLREGIDAYEGEAVDPAVLVAEGQSVGTFLAFAHALVEGHDRFQAEVFAAIWSYWEGASQETITAERTEAMLRARRVKRRT